MITYQIEPFRDVYPEAFPLLINHWKEVASDTERLRFNPDIDTYLFLDDNQKLTVITAREGRELVGYIVLIVQTHLHYKDVLTVVEDVHYLRPEHRKGWAGYKLLKAAMEYSRNISADIVIFRSKTIKGQDALFKRLGCFPQDHSFVAFLKGK